MKNKTLTKINVSLAALMSVLAPTMTAAQDAGSPNPASILTRSLDNMPRAQGSRMADDISGQNIFGQDASASGQSPSTQAPAVDLTDAIEAASENAEGSLAVEAAERTFEDDIDPITKRSVQILDDTGLIGRQMRIAEGMVMMDQQIRYAEKIEEVLAVLGPDAKIEVSPGEFQSFAGTPASMRAEIEYINLQKDLIDAQAELLEIQTGVSRNGSGDDDVRADGRPNLPTRSDGSEYSMMPEDNGFASPADFGLIDPPVGQGQSSDAERQFAQREAELLMIIADLESRAEQMKPQSMMSDLDAVTIREIFGSTGMYIAVIDVMGQRSEVRVGDRVLEGYTISSINGRSVAFEKDGDEWVVNF